jgi:type I restriction enzyme S subunit
LDHKTAQIDALIGKKQRQIELLQEKRQALISEAVTNGLDSDASMKDSGIDWLRQTPCNWSVERLKYSITRIEQGWSPQCDNQPAEEGQWGVLKVGCVNWADFDPDEQKALPAQLEPIESYEIKPYDILMSRGNTRELVGSAALVRDVRPRLLLCDLLYRFRANPKRAEPEFLVLALRSPYVRYQIEREATGTSSSMKKIGQETIGEFLICLPPLQEQREILARLRPELDHIDNTISLVQRQTDKLHEYRQTLITAAVTGKLDVDTEATC